MYKKAVLLFLIGFVVASFSLSIEKEVSSFSYIKDITLSEDKVYVLDYPNEKIAVYDLDLNFEKKLNIGRRYFRDVAYYDGALYAVQSLGLFRIYPTREHLNNFTSSISSFQRDVDYFYFTYYTGYVAKIKGEEKLIEQHYADEKMKKIFDSALSEKYLFVSSEHEVYVFEKENLTFVKKKKFEESITGITYSKGFLIVTTESRIFLYTPDFEYVEELDSIDGLIKVYLASNNRLIGFSNSSLYLFSDPVVSPLEMIEKKKKEIVLTIDEMVELSFLMKNESYGKALKYLEEIEISRKPDNNESVNETNKSDKYVNVPSVFEGEEESDPTLLFTIVVLFMGVSVIVLFIAYKIVSSGRK